MMRQTGDWGLDKDGAPKVKHTRRVFPRPGSYDDVVDDHASPTMSFRPKIESLPVP